MKISCHRLFHRLIQQNDMTDLQCKTCDIKLYILQKPCVTTVQKFFSKSKVVSSFLQVNDTASLLSVLIKLLQVLTVIKKYCRNFITSYRTYVILSIILCRRRTMPGWWISYEQKRNSLFCELCQHMASKVCTTKIFFSGFR